MGCRNTCGKQYIKVLAVKELEQKFCQDNYV